MRSPLVARAAAAVIAAGTLAAQVDAARGGRGGRGGRAGARYVPVEEMRGGRARVPAVLARRVTVRRERAPLQQALVDVATQAGLGLSYGEELVLAAPRVTLDLRDVAAVDALAAAARGTGFAVLVTAGGQVAVVREVACATPAASPGPAPRGQPGLRQEPEC